MRVGLELLRSRKVVTNLDTLSYILGCEIPESLSLFLSNYKLGQEGFLNAKISFEDIYLPITAVEYYHVGLKAPLRLSHFYNVEELERRWKEDVVYSDLFLKHTMLPIAYTEINLDHVMVNIEGKGSIWYFDEEETPVFLSSNIFNFCNQIRETEILDPSLDGKNLYQNWGEDFWRIRE